MHATIDTLKRDRAALMDVLNRDLGVTDISPRGQFRCPCHDDERPSAGIYVQRNGVVAWKCQACGAGGNIVDTLIDQRGLDFAGVCARYGIGHGGNAEPVNGQSRNGKPRRVYDTLDAIATDVLRQVRAKHPNAVETGRYVYDNFDVVLRFDWPSTNGGDHKTFRPVHETADGWVIGKPAGLAPLWRLNDLDLDQPVYLVEGEKACLAARAAGLNATCWQGGANAVAGTNFAPLHGLPVRMLPDNDESGRVAMNDVGTGLAPHGGDLRVVTIPDLPPKGDVHDMLAARSEQGLEPSEVGSAIRHLADAAPRFRPANAVPHHGKPRPHVRFHPILRNLADVEPQPIRWLWPGRVPLGKLTVIAGDPGLGKSFITIDMAARVSAGLPFPDGGPAKSGDVVLLSAEDDAADTIRPRLDAANGDPSRVAILDAVILGDREVGFTLDAHLEALDQAIREQKNCLLVVVDPLTAFLGGADSHKNAEVRAVLKPLSDLAARTGVAVVAVTHLRKSEGPAIYRPMGSLAFTAAARVVYAVVKDSEDLARRLLLPVKANITGDGSGLAYRLAEGKRGLFVEWELRPVVGNADDYMSDSERGGTDSSALQEAKDWLLDLLSGQPVPSGDVKRRAKADGIAERTLERAKRALGVVSRKVGYSWVWMLPDADT